MKRPFRRTRHAFWIACLLSILCACSTGESPPDTGTDDIAVTENLLETGVNLSGYTIVVPRKSTDDESSFMMTLNKAAAQSSLGMSNDNFDPVETEILIGATSREETALITAEIAALGDGGAFHYAIALVNNKLVLYADDARGYEYLKSQLNLLILDGVLYAPENLHEVVSVTMDEYMKSDIYAAALEKEQAAAKRKEEREQALAEQAQKTHDETVDKLKAMNEAFTLAQFGTITQMTNPYGDPVNKPTAGEHPRVYFTASKLETIRENLTAEENAAAYEKYLTLSDTRINYGQLEKKEDTHNVDYNVLNAIEAKAFRYALEGDELYGYEAIVSIKNFMTTLHIPDGAILDYSRPYGQVIYTAGMVYDWCYDLLTADDMAQLTAGVETILAPPMEIGFPPSKQGAVTGHGSEAQLLRDWFAFAIATADEYPDIYDFVAGRIENQFVPAANFYLTSGSHWQGSAYGQYRYYYLLIAESLYRGMSDEDISLFSDDLERPAITFIHYIRPDGQSIRVGDDYNEYGTSYSQRGTEISSFLAATLYQNPILKGFAKEGLNNFSSFSTSNEAFTSVLSLIMNDVSLACEDPHDLSLVVENGSPLGSIIARTKWDTEDTAMVYMKVGEAYSANHEHKDAGSFQIFYNGILASDSGSYFWYGTDHDYSYHKQTISSNALLIYNPNRTDNGKWRYSGGQQIAKNNEYATLESWQQTGTDHLAKIIGMESATVGTPGANEKVIFSYLAGDLTNAYDADTVDEVSRYMLSVMTDDEEYPMIFATYDRITADDASYKKTALIHVQEEPTVTDDGFVIVTNTQNGNHGKMIVQSVGTPTTKTVIGGEGQEYVVNGVNIANEHETRVDGGIGEFGWGRVELSPVEAAKTDRLLTLMYVTDSENDDAPIRAEQLESDKFDGAQLMDQAMFFAKESTLIDHAVTLETADSTSGELGYYIVGVAAGEWTVQANGKAVGTYTVADQGLLHFTAPAGKITLAPAK